MGEAENPTIRLMEAVRYGKARGLTERRIRELVEAALAEPVELPKLPLKRGGRWGA